MFSTWTWNFLLLVWFWIGFFGVKGVHFEFFFVVVVALFSVLFLIVCFPRRTRYLSMDALFLWHFLRVFSDTTTQCIH